VVLVGTVGVLVAAGAGTAWAMSGSGGPSYRLASVVRADVSQTVDADGTLAAKNTSTVAFAAAGTVDSVRVGVGDEVSAGERLATIDKSDLESAVTSAETSVAQAKQRLADDEEAQATGTPTTSSSSTSGANNHAGTDSTSSVRLTASTTVTATETTPAKSTAPNTGGSTSAAAIRAAQKRVESAQRALDDAIAAVSDDVNDLNTSCTTSVDPKPVTKTVVADSGGTVSGSVGEQAMVATLLDTTTTSTNPQSDPAGGSYSYEGLTAGNPYQVVLVPVVDTAACAKALDTIKTDQSDKTNNRSVVSAKAALDQTIGALEKLITAQSSSGSGGGSGSGPGGGSGSASGSSAGSGTRAGGTGSASSRSGSASGGTGSGSGGTTGGSGGPAASGSSTGMLVTAEQIAADTKAIDAADAELAVAKRDVGFATLTAPVSGTVATVGLAKGDAVSASSTSATIKVVGSGALSVDLSIGLADIDLVKVGEAAQVTVDGRTKPIPARVTLVGTTNSASSTGSSSAYTVTVGLGATDATLYDGMGASVAIDVGTAKNVVSVPISAVHSIATLHTVSVDAGGKVTTKRVTLGVEGAERVQVLSGLSVGDQVVLADISASVPSSNTTVRRGGTTLGGGLTGGGGLGGGGLTGGGGFGGRTGGGGGGGGR
jgi:multidrug efflux pump subunit AcrA (membrane-fusion protein)